MRRGVYSATGETIPSSENGINFRHFSAGASSGSSRKASMCEMGGAISDVDVACGADCTWGDYNAVTAGLRILFAWETSPRMFCNSYRARPVAGSNNQYLYF